jgi:hypothetical protein
VHGFTSRFGIVRKPTTTDQTITFSVGIQKNSMGFCWHNSGGPTKFGKLIRSLKDKQDWRGKNALCDLVSKKLLVSAGNVSFRVRFDANLNHNLVFRLAGRRLAAMFLEDVVNLDVTPNPVECVLLSAVNLSCPA